MYYELIVLGLICLASPALAKIAGFETGRKPFDLIGVGGMFLLLSAAFGLGMNLVLALADIGKSFMLVSMLLGWVALGAGAVWGTIDVIREPDHGLLRHKA
ncbi:MAG TPA: hypothetical protein VNL17_13665 [Verrucomicrobiae bacterium]|nr:hypothetical protein [Verrucomicrobiae bacterium]